jgi:hypothetical protein
MDFNSKYFDSIRIKKPGGKRKAEPREVQCQWDGCDKPATHKAPMGRDHEGQYLDFCFDHVREYNKTYNYFSGLDDDSVAKFHKDSLTGHRPTWTMGVNRWGSAEQRSTAEAGWTASSRVRARLNRDSRAPGGQRRKPRALEAKALDDLRLPVTASADEIKSRYKELVKRHHPDANGGDRSSEERLRQIIHAYKVLKQAGFC